MQSRPGFVVDWEDDLVKNQGQKKGLKGKKGRSRHFRTNGKIMAKTRHIYTPPPFFFSEIPPVDH